MVLGPFLVVVTSMSQLVPLLRPGQVGAPEPESLKIFITRPKAGGYKSVRSDIVVAIFHHAQKYQAWRHIPLA